MFFCSLDKDQSLPGAKRGRLLIRQSRVKKDMDAMNQHDDMDFETSYSHRNLTVPHPKMERHASEPAPRMSSPPPSSSTSSSSHLLTVPTITKQHSCDIPYSHHQHHPHLSLHRQLSYPGSTESSPHGHPQTMGSTSTSSITAVPIANLSSPGIGCNTISLSPRSLGIHPQLHHSVSFKSDASDYSINLSGDNSSTSAMTSEKAQDLSPSNYVVVTEPMSLSFEHVPSIRVKTDELRRSISSPQVNIRFARVSVIAQWAPKCKCVIRCYFYRI